MEPTLEIEVKLACDNLERLSSAGFELREERPRHFEDNWLLDSADQTLFKKGAALRVRSVEGRGWVTYKGLVRESAGSILKIREEIETETSEPERMIELLERLGLRRVFRYQKYRTTYHLLLDGGQVEVSFDETPLGNFVEIEGTEAQIMRILERAGFSAEEIIRDSYPELQAAHCRNAGLPLADLVF